MAWFEEFVNVVKGAISKVQPAHISFNDEAEGQVRNFMRDGGTYEEVTVARATPPVQHHPVNVDLDTTESLIKYVDDHMDKDKALIVFNSVEVVAFRNHVNREEKAAHSFGMSLEYKTLLGVGGSKDFSQKQLFTALSAILQDVTITPPEMLANISLIKVSKDVSFEGDIDPDSIKARFTNAGGEQVTDIPRFFTANIPIFDGSDYMEVVRVDIDVDTDGSRIQFTLTNHRHDQTIQNVVDYEGEQLVEKLPGFNIYMGSTDAVTVADSE